jgi:TonB family protein
VHSPSFGRTDEGSEHKKLAIVLSLLVLTAVVAWCSAAVPRVNPNRRALSQSERSLRRVPAHISEFAPFSEPLALPKCGSVRPPEPLLTPDPLLPVEDEDLLVRVSFIVGSDGYVHSAFVLDGAGSGEDEAVLRAVRQWRYRPALCNGVPTDSEARVRFSIR